MHDAITRTCLRIFMQVFVNVETQWPYQLHGVIRNVLFPAF